MKKVLCLITSFAMCGLFALNVHAAEGITTEEQKIVDSLKAGVVVGGEHVSVPIEYINQAETFLKTKDVDAATVAGILADIDGVKNVIMEHNITDLKEIKGSIASDIFARAQSAASKVGVTLKLNGDNSVSVLDKDGKEIFIAGVANAIKDTGDDYTILFIVSGGIAMILVGASILAGKKGYLTK